MTNPILPSPGGPPGNVDFPVPEGQGHLFQNPGAAIRTDSLSSGWLSLADYLHDVTDATSKLRATLYDNASQAALLYRGSYINILDSLFGIIQKAQDLINACVPFVNLKAQIDSQTGEINHAMPAIQNSVQLVNEAILAYNASIPDAATSASNLRAIADQHNALANELDIAGYDSKVNQYNAMIPTAIPLLNAAFAAAGQPLISSISPIHTSGIPSNIFPTIPPRPIGFQFRNPLPIPASPTFFPPTISEILTFQAPNLGKIITISSSITDLIKNLIAFAQKLSQLNPNDPTLPEAVVQKNPEILFQTDTGGASVGSSAQMVGLATGSGSPILSRVLNNAAAESVYTESTDKSPSTLINQLNVLTLGLATHSATDAALATAQQLSDNPVSPSKSSKAFNIISGVNYASGIRDLVNSSFVSDGVNRVVNSSEDLTHLSTTQKQELAKSTTAVVSLGLLNIGLLQISRALELPGLPSQVLGNVNGIAGPHEGQATPATILFEDPLEAIHLKINLAQQVSASHGIPSDAANVLSNAVINDILASKITINSAEDLHDAVVKSAQGIAKNGIPVPPPPTNVVGGTSTPASAYPAATAAAGNPAVVNTLANTAASFLNTELSLPFLNLPFVASSLNPVLPSSAPPPSLVQNLTETLVAANPLLFTPSGTGEFISRSLGESLQRSKEDAGTVAGHFATILKEQGVEAPLANQLANQTVERINTNRRIGQSFEQAMHDTLAGTPAPVLTNANGELAAQIRRAIEGNTALGIGLGDAVATSPVTIRELHTSLLTALSGQNVPEQQAQNFAKAVATLAAPAAPNDHIAPFFHRTPSAATLPPPDIAERVIDYLLNTLGPLLGELRAREIANTTVRTLISTNSILTAYNEQLRTLREEARHDVLRKFLFDSVPAVVTPNTPMYSLTNEIGGLSRSQVDIVMTYMSPVAQASLMNSVPSEEPIGFRDLDIRI